MFKMRFNEKELVTVASGKADKEGRLNHKSTGFRDVFKERWFKLKGNLLFYFRLNEYGGISEKEPAGLLVMEHCTIQQENLPDLSFVFTVEFQDDRERKHMFCCTTETHCQEWVKCLREASYEHQRAKLLIIQARIFKLTGRDPLAAFPSRRRDQKNCGHLHKSMSKTYSDPHMSMASS